MARLEWDAVKTFEEVRMCRETGGVGSQYDFRGQGVLRSENVRIKVR